MDQTYPCPTSRAVGMLGGKWRVSILGHLKEGPLHHGELRRALPGISQKVLTQTLRGLQHAGLVTRTPVDDRVRYALSDEGELAREALTALYALGQRWEDPRSEP